MCSPDVDELVAGVRRFIADPALAAATGKAAREHALAHFGLQEFLHRWDGVLAAAVVDAGLLHLGVDDVLAAARTLPHRSREDARG